MSGCIVCSSLPQPDAHRRSDFRLENLIPIRGVEILALKLFKLFEVLRREGFAHTVLFVEPFPEIDHFASIRAKWAHGFAEKVGERLTNGAGNRVLRMHRGEIGAA